MRLQLVHVRNGEIVGVSLIESLSSAGDDDDHTSKTSLSFCAAACMVGSATDEPKSPVEGKACERRDAFRRLVALCQERVLRNLYQSSARPCMVIGAEYLKCYPLALGTVMSISLDLLITYFGNIT